MNPMFSPAPDTWAQSIIQKQMELTRAWHVTDLGKYAEAIPETLPADFFETVTWQHSRNFLLWHEEDIARSPSVSDSRIADVKRAIDKLNQKRNDLIEVLDDMILSALTQAGIKPTEGTRWNSETPGSMIDRLSIVSLKIFHMKEQEERTDTSAEHIANCKTKREVLQTQQADLCQALAWQIEDMLSGKRCMKLYRQFKMYNDPSLNPAIYAAQRNEAKQ